MFLILMYIRRRVVFKGYFMGHDLHHFARGKCEKADFFCFENDLHNINTISDENILTPFTQGRQYILN